MTTRPRSDLDPLHGREDAARDALATLSDHLGRVLAQADRLLREWQTHADGVRGRLDAEAAAAVDALHRTLQAAVADAATQASVQVQRALGEHAAAVRADLERARQAAADLEAHMRRIAGGARATSVDELHAALRTVAAHVERVEGHLGGRRARLDRALLALALAGNVLLVILFLVFGRSGERTPPGRAGDAPAPTATATTAPASAPEPPAPAEGGAGPSGDVPAAGGAPTGPEAARATSGAPPPAPGDGTAPEMASGAPCAGLGRAGPAAPRLVQECLNQVCAPKPKLRVDGDLPPGGAAARALAACRPADPAAADLVAALRVLARDRTLHKLACPPPPRDAQGGHTVTVAWLLECPRAKR